MAQKIQYWLFKSDPETFGIVDLKKSPKRTTSWEGVRNYQARNFLRDEVKEGDKILFYHSQVDPPAVMGTAVVTRSAYPDDTQYEEKSKYFDPKATVEKPRWFMVDIRLDCEFEKPVALSQLREHPALQDMELLRKGSRLSIQPVKEIHWKVIGQLAK